MADIVSRAPSDVDRTAVALFTGVDVEFKGSPLLTEQTLDVPLGSVLVLMGPSGVGKSVLADVVFGLKKDGGDLRVSTGIGEARTRGALVFQSSGGLPHLSVYENLFVVCPDPKRIDHEATQLGLLADQLAGELSGGQQRKLAAARGRLSGREFIWLDEPAAGLDERSMGQLALELRRLAEDGVAFVVTTHRVGFAAEIADEVRFLNGQGKLVPIPLRELDSSDRRTALDAALKGLLEIAHDNGVGRDQALIGRPGFIERMWKAVVQAPPRALGALLVWLETALTGAASIGAVLSPGGRVGRRTLWYAIRIGVIGGAQFYLYVGAVFGGIFLLIFELSLPYLSTPRLVIDFGPTIVLRVAPAFAGILVAAKAGSVVSAWVGQMAASRQLDGLRILQIPVDRYVTGPAWLGLSLAGPVGTFFFGAALVFVFALYLAMVTDGGVAEMGSGFGSGPVAWALLKASGYGLLVSSVTVAFAAEPKHKPDEVAHSMTQGIVWSTVAVMLAELIVLLIRMVG